MRNAWLLAICIAVLSGCSSTISTLTYSEVAQEDLNKEIQTYFENAKEENGVHLYLDEGNDSMFVYLNSTNVVLGETAEIFTDFDVENEQNSIRLSYKSEETIDLSGSPSDYSIFYKIDLNQSYESVKLFHNGDEASFRSVSGGG